MYLSVSPFTCLSARLPVYLLRKCYAQSESCDGKPHCVNKADEKDCTVYGNYPTHLAPPPPAVVYHDRVSIVQALGGVTMRPLRPANVTGASSVCPETHFQCPG